MHRINIIYALIPCLFTTAEEWKPKCPIGFELQFDKTQNEYICYNIKGPETYKDKFVDCAGNLYNSESHSRLNVGQSNSLTFWLEYSSLYAGGPFIDWAYSEHEPKLIYNTSYSSSMTRKLCLITNSIQTITAVECNELHFRYCIVKPYSEDYKSEDCCHLNSRRFYSPKETCLTVLSGLSDVTWPAAKNLCKDKGGTLLSRGWLYGNVESLNSLAYPLGMVWDSEQRLVRYATDGEIVEVSSQLFVVQIIG